MTEATSSPLLHALRRLAEDQQLAGLPDQELLGRFLDRHDGGAVQALVRRHGPMVLDVCRTLVPDEADAEDAFQATFLVLLRNARSIRKGASLASWLHGVAYRTAAKARAAYARRRKHETLVPARTPAGPDDPAWRDARQVVHEELDGLGDKLRAPLVLCYLQDKTQDEAAALLGLPKGTLKGRLERGRALLRQRLVRRGLGPAAGLLAAAWPADAAAGVPPDLVAAVSQTAAHFLAGEAVTSAKVAALAEAVRHGLLVAKAKSAASLVLLVAVLGLGGGMLVWQNAAAEQLPPAAQTTDDPNPDASIGRAGGQGQGRGDEVSRVVARFAEQLQRSPVRRLPGGDQLGLYLMDLQGGDATLIAAVVDQERAYCGSPCWSKDGRRILFDASPGQQWSLTRLQMLEATEQGPGLSSFGPGNCPALSPDGSRVAFLLNPGAVPGAKTGLYVMNADGSDRRWLGGSGKPRWSPDGKQILTVSFANPCQLSLIDVATGRERPVPAPPGQAVYSVPSWVSDGTLVALVRGPKGFDLALLDVTDPDRPAVKESLWRRGDGTNVEPLYPVYSPQARRGVFVGRDKEGQALYSFRPGEVPRPLEPGRKDGKIASLALSPDGRYVLFCSDRP